MRIGAVVCFVKLSWRTAVQVPTGPLFLNKNIFNTIENKKGGSAWIEPAPMGLLRHPGVCLGWLGGKTAPDLNIGKYIKL